MLNQAIQVAAAAHGDQKRKGTDIPYITHPFMVAMTLSQAGYPEDVVVAGVLHDTIEDTDLTLDDIKSRFGKRVADIVQGCSEEDRTLSWKARKQHTIDYLKTAPIEVRAASCADKLDNAMSMLADYREMGESLCDRFNTGKKEQEWYYRGLVTGLCNRLDQEPLGSIFHQLKDTVDELFGISQGE